MIAHLRNGETYTDLAAGFGIGTTTAFGYIRRAAIAGNLASGRLRGEDAELRRADEVQ